MGYTTEFKGRFELDKPLTKELADYLQQFSENRHYRISRDLIMELDPDWEKHCFNGDLGKDGQYYLTDYVGDFFRGPNRKRLRELQGQDNFDYNCTPSEDVPGLWCQWVPSEDLMGLEWDQGEKFYNYVEWIEYLIDNFLAPQGYTVNGSVRWRGESFDDIGVIDVTDNIVSSRCLPDW